MFDCFALLFQFHGGVCEWCVWGLFKSGAFPDGRYLVYQAADLGLFTIYEHSPAFLIAHRSDVPALKLLTLAVD